VSIDQPRGIRQAVQTLAAKLGSLHEAHHQVMECLGEMIWTSQRSGQPPDPHAYLDCVQRRAVGRSRT
jgi:predicted RNA polymerase sigma factor